ncbi:hypothetical protein PVAP13_7KG073036 [Panicum virgatum]|uniref:Uncharacterized protein n=1 Tax=Panicum virgatum TaxID=38727 RepID=A0A8T0Q8I8_PANVG|nr:hypothetical protein PVAP13_7KG073036 [Panicum virgatum]
MNWSGLECAEIDSYAKQYIIYKWPPPRSPPPHPRSFGRFLQLATGEFLPPPLPRKVEGKGIDGVGRSPDQGSRGASLAVDVRGSATPYNPPTRCSLSAAAHRVGSGGAQAVERPSVRALSSDELSGRPIDPLRPSERPRTHSLPIDPALICSWVDGGKMDHRCGCGCIHVVNCGSV